ncbi:MAG: hypothetical protein KBD14_02180 [Candidatus Pacebacteria bacterium]|nr:hypothetical protein [Candidatus Paceibacterota bacterium]
MTIKNIDLKLIAFFNRAFMPVARFGLFVIFFWFGALKVVGLSPASGVVARLFEQTIPFMSFDSFLILFGLFECLIGVLFAIKGLERIVIPLLFIHMITTFGPLVFLTSETWSSFMVPTLEGQYIIKNLVIIATAIGVAAKVKPLE